MSDPSASPLAPKSPSDANEAPGADGTVARKADHIRINLEADVAAKGVTTGLEAYRFVHQALPEIDLDDVSTATSVLGKALGAPILISCMTGGTRQAERLNAGLAETASELGLAMGLGSGRVLFEDPEARDGFDVRRRAPGILLFANLGAVQLNKGVGVEGCRRLVDSVGADALVVHLNPLQEALQPNGDTRFGGLLKRIADLCARLERPVIAKEVGWGLSGEVVRMLFDAGVSAVDVAGAGGTSWSEVERHRLSSASSQRVAAAFSGWGIPTAEALRGARAAVPEGTVFASGGIRDGIDVAKAIALGADLVGVAGPFIRAAANGPDQAMELARELTSTLRLAMFCTGAGSIAELRDVGLASPPTAGPSLRSAVLSYQTSAAGQFLDITDDVNAVVERSGIRTGHVHVYSNQTTAAIRINENEPMLLEDSRAPLDRLAPRAGHRHDDHENRVDVPTGEPRNGHAHARQLLLASSETIPVAAGRMRLGRSQRVFLIELRSARARTVSVHTWGVGSE